MSPWRVALPPGARQRSVLLLKGQDTPASAYRSRGGRLYRVFDSTGHRNDHPQRSMKKWLKDKGLSPVVKSTNEKMVYPQRCLPLIFGSLKSKTDHLVITPSPDNYKISLQIDAKLEKTEAAKGEPDIHYSCNIIVRNTGTHLASEVYVQLTDFNPPPSRCIRWSGQLCGNKVPMLLRAIAKLPVISTHRRTGI